MERNEKEEKYPTNAYVLGGMLYVPHYREEGVYVAPGGQMATEGELVCAGAKRKMEMLWKRNWQVRKAAGQLKHAGTTDQSR